MWQGPLEKIDAYRWRIPKSYKQGMRTDGIIFASEKLIGDIRNDKAAEQVANVAFLPGIVSSSMAMPDIHWGYGFPIGGVAATDARAAQPIFDAWLRGGRPAVREFIESAPQPSQDTGPYYHWLAGRDEEFQRKMLEIHKRLRGLCRKEAAKLG